MVFGVGGQVAAGRSPDIRKLMEEAQSNNYNIFCPLTQDKSCLTLKYFSRGGGNQHQRRKGDSGTHN